MHLFSSGATVLRPADLYLLSESEELKSALELCNIYFIVRRPKITLCPHSIRTQFGKLYGDFLVHEGSFNFQRFPFKTGGDSSRENFPLLILSAQVADQHGNALKVQFTPSDHAIVPVNRLIAQSAHSLNEHTELDVLYVGQGKGRKISRTAFQRLYAHVTLQRIMAESMLSHPDSEILLLLFKFEHSRNIISTGGDFSVEPTATQSEELEHFNKIMDVTLDRNARINLAEAALINYFKPHYNIHYKEIFRSGKLKIVEKLIEKDLTGIIVEINTANIRCKLRSTYKKARTLRSIFSPEQISQIEKSRSQPDLKDDADELILNMTHTHHVEIPLFSPEERETFLHSLPWKA